MNPQFSRTQFPNGGWQFHQPQTGWTAPTPKSSTFDQTVQLIIAMRRKNPAAVIKHGLSVDTVVVGNELEAFTRRRLGIPLPSMSLQNVPIPGVSNSAVTGVTEIKRLAVGMAMLLSWERSGQPAVDIATAQKRAEKCAKCPLNSSPRLVEWAKSPIGHTAYSKTRRIADLSLKFVPTEQLGLCLGLMVPALMLCSEPAELIQAKLKEADKGELDGNCWIRS